MRKAVRRALAATVAAAGLVLPLALVHASHAADGRPAVVRQARTVAASSVSTLSAALAKAAPGDRVTLAAGVYSSGTVKITRSGTAAAPIRVSAAKVGAAQFTGGAKVEFGPVSHVVLEGFLFKAGAGLNVPAGAKDVRITRNTFDNVKGNVVSVSADNTEVDHNAFQNKTSAGVYLQVNGPGGGKMARNVRVHHNFFFNHQFKGANGGESVRFGLSSRQHGDARGVIENNLFEKADGDSEAISIKSSNNIVRHNTLINTKGTISLRHGSGTVVDGNFVIGGRSGIRFFGNNHTIVNNVVQDSSGLAMEVGGGEIRDDTDSTTAHEAADHCVVAFNTLVGTGGRVVKYGSGKQFAPSDVTLADNIIVGKGGGAVSGTGGALRFQGNLLSGASAGSLPAGGFKTADPKLTRGAGNLFRLSAGSPALNAAVGSFGQVTVDMDGVTRTGAKDVGADELGGAQLVPLTRADVGPAAK